MPAQILAVGSTDANSGDVTVGEGEQLTVSLKDAAGPFIATGARVEIQLKDDAAQYFTVDTLNAGKSSVVIAGAGTYRFKRRGGTACGVFSG